MHKTKSTTTLLSIWLTLAGLLLVPGANAANYTKMNYGYNNCPAQFGEIKRGVSEDDMVRMATAANAEGFTYHPGLGYGKLLIGSYPEDCKSHSSLSWPLYLRDSALLPNLYVSEFKLTPATPAKGQPVAVRVGVYNRGTAPTGRFNVEWWPGENYKSPACSWTVDSLVARGGKILTCRYDGYPSRYASIPTKAVVDSGGTVAESNENDNIKKMVIRVSKASALLPNLYVSEFKLTPATPAKGQPVAVRVGVYNRGTAPTGRFNVEWWPGENYKSPACSWTVDSLVARGGKILTCRYDGYPSRYASIPTKAVVDSGGTVVESNENDNIKKMVIRVR